MLIFRYLSLAQCVDVRGTPPWTFAQYSSWIYEYPLGPYDAVAYNVVFTPTSLDLVFNNTNQTEALILPAGESNAGPFGRLDINLEYSIFDTSGLPEASFNIEKKNIGIFLVVSFFTCLPVIYYSRQCNLFIQ